MKSASSYILVVLTVFVLAVCSVQAWSSEVISESTAKSISDSITPFLVVGELSLLSDKQEFIQSTKALGATYLATALLKRVVHEKRPNTDSELSFPSGHAATAFAMATVLAEYKPAYKWPAYATASLIGFSRVEAGSHYWRDVAAGALLGHFIAKQFTSDHIVATPQGVAMQWNW